MNMTFLCKVLSCKAAALFADTRLKVEPHLLKLPERNPLRHDPAGGAREGKAPAGKSPGSGFGFPGY